MRVQKFVRAAVSNSILGPPVDRACEGDVPSWTRFVEIVYPGLWLIAGRWTREYRLVLREDEQANVVLAIIERLHDDNFRRLGGLREAIHLRNEGGWPWLATMAARTAVIYGRGHPENVGTRAEPRLIGLEPLPLGVEETLPDSVRGERIAEGREIMARAAVVLSHPQLRAVRLWSVGWDFGEIADEVRLASAHDADLLVRSAINLLRRHLRGGDDL